MKAILYMHGGSENHGCEALVRSTVKINSTLQFDLVSKYPQEDIAVGLDMICENIIQESVLKRFSRAHLTLKMKSILTNKEIFEYGNTYQYLFKKVNRSHLHISIGGDNYCYGIYPLILGYINKRLSKKGSTTVLFGCSIEPSLLENQDVVDDLNRYSLITARESITYEALKQKNITKNLHLFPDPAFTLDSVQLELPAGFDESNTIGINVSPLIQTLENNSGITLTNYQKLIAHILANTNLQVALIPHVTRANNNDLTPLTQLYTAFKESGRVVLIPDHNCMELKGFISRCRLFIGARTHATIAAYSTFVPTLVVGYSVKAKGIAKDIFGDYEHYVIPVQSLENEDDLIRSFDWLLQNEDQIRKHLKSFMPSYCAKAYEAATEVRKLMV